MHQMLAQGWQTTPNGRGQGDVTLFYILPPIVFVESVKLGTFNVAYWLIQRRTNAQMIEIVQDRDMVAMEV